MVEFALVLPLLMAIIALIVSVSSIYAVRNAAHKMTYDAARHVAKVDQARYTGCHNDLKAADQAEVQRVVDYYFDKDTGDVLLKNMTANLSIDAVSTGPPIPSGTQGAAYYCPQSVEVTISYDINVPFWAFLEGLYGHGNGRLTERALAARLVPQYENVPCDEQRPKC